ncbi:hypothetical protein RI054_09g46290 [Pseudoscourfieldia marina]
MAALSFTSCLVVALSLLTSVHALKCYSQGNVTVPSCSCHPTCGTCGYTNDPTKAVDCITCADGSAVKPVYADGTGYCGEPPTGSNCFVQPEVALDNCKCHPTCGTCGYNNDPTKAVDCITCADGSAVKPVYADGTGYCGEPPPGTSDDTSGGQAPTSYHVVKSSMTLEGVTKDTFDAAKFSAGMAAALGLEADLIRVQDVTEVSRRHLLAAGVKVDFMVAADDVADATQGAASLKALDPTKIVESLKVAGIPVTAVSAIEAAPGEVAASEVDATSPTAKAPSPAPATTTKAPATTTTKAPVKKTSGALGAAPSFVVATAIAAMAA